MAHILRENNSAEHSSIEQLKAAYAQNIPDYFLQYLLRSNGGFYQNGDKSDVFRLYSCERIMDRLELLREEKVISNNLLPIGNDQSGGILLLETEGEDAGGIYITYLDSGEDNMYLYQDSFDDLLKS